MILFIVNQELITKASYEKYKKYHETILEIFHKIKK